MARLVQQLTEAKIRGLTKIGLHPDGAGLYLQIKAGAVVMQADLGERANLCFGELLNKSRHENPLVGCTHVPQRPYAAL